MKNPYEDIINLPHHTSKTHPPMALSMRAPQFSPFAALTGYGEAIKESGRETYTGPSVISYSLDGRKALNLPVPAYRCLGGGDVTVRITVSQSGRVMNAEVEEEFSSADKCLRDYAVRAARLSVFTASGSAPKRQYGEIVYRFIAQ